MEIDQRKSPTLEKPKHLCFICYAFLSVDVVRDAGRGMRCAALTLSIFALHRF